MRVPARIAGVTRTPSEIDGATVLKVADLAGTTATGYTRHESHGELQVGFTKLAITQYEGGVGTYLFYCDDEWRCLNDTYHDDAAAAEERAALEFDGVRFTEP
jgi:hypothetical protein